MNRKIINLAVIVFSLFLWSGNVPSGYCEEEEKGNFLINVLTGRYAAVKGNEKKFRAHHWMKDGFVSGIEHMSYEGEFGKNFGVEFEGRAIPEENDHEVLLILNKGDDAFVKTEYKTFRKYYDDYGGVAPTATVLKSNHLNNQDLQMDMGHFEIELGLGNEHYPDVSLMYQRHTKEGIKSRLTWTAVKERFLTRNIGPAWQQIDEDVDIITLAGKKEIAGINFSAEQKAEYARSSNTREEKYLATTGVAADTKIRLQEQKPTSEAYATSLRGEKWIVDEKTFLSFGYHRNHISNTENELLREFSATYVPTSYGSFPEQKLPSDAENRLTEDIWTGHIQTNLTPKLSLISKIKYSYLGREGSSSYYNNKTPSTPDNIVDTTEVSLVENRINRLGENLSLRYTGLAKTTLYTELEMEQIRNWISEYRDSVTGQSTSSDNDRFKRETLTSIQKTVWTAGGRVVPNKWLEWTMHARQIYSNNDYDDIQESVPTGTAKSAFIDDMKIRRDEIATRLGWKPFQWLQSAVKYQYLVNKYSMRAQAEDKTKSQWLAHVLSYDVNIQPIDTVLMTLSFSRLQSTVTTPAGSAASAKTPGFDSGVYSWLWSTSYTPKENLSFINTVQYSRADNYNQFYDTGLPLGAEYEQIDITTGLEWSPKKNVTIKPMYSYASYIPNDNVDTGEYTAHIVWMDTTFKW